MANKISVRATAGVPRELPLTPTRGMPKRTGRGITLVIIAALAIIALNTTTDLALHGTVATSTIILTCILVACMIGAWILVRLLAPYADPIIITCATLLSAIGVSFIRRLDTTTYAVNAENTSPDPSVFAGTGGRQLIYYLLALAVFTVVLAALRDHKILRSYAYILGFGGLVLAAIPGLLPSSISEVNGAKNWINLGFISFQPSEFAKIALMIFFAYYLVQKRDVLSAAGKKFLGIQFPRIRDLGPIIIMWVASMGILVLENDLGSSLLFFALFMAMLYMATRRVSWIIIGLVLFLGGCAAIYPFFSHLQLRVRIWLDPFNEAYVDGDSYQLVQSLIGLGEGGLFGVGPGSGNPDIIPFANSDFILASLGEEIGLIGLTAILVLYGILVERAFKTGVMLRDGFGKVLAGGFGFSIAFQIFIVAGGISALIPLTGLTTPFLAAGGSSLLASWILLALLIRMSNEARKPWQPSFGINKMQPPPEWFAVHGNKPVAEVDETTVITTDKDLQTQIILMQKENRGEIVSEAVTDASGDFDVVETENSSDVVETKTTAEELVEDTAPSETLSDDKEEKPEK